METKSLFQERDSVSGFGSAADFSQLPEAPKSGGLFYRLVLIFLAAVVLISLVLWGYQFFLKKTESQLETRISELNEQRDLKLEAEFAGISDSISMLKILLRKRLAVSAVFGLFEQLTLNQVWFPSLRVDFEKSEAAVEVETIDYNTLAKQINVFKHDSRIKQIDGRSIELRETGRVGTNLTIQFLASALTAQ